MGGVGGSIRARTSNDAAPTPTRKRYATPIATKSPRRSSGSRRMTLYAVTPGKMLAITSAFSNESCPGKSGERAYPASIVALAPTLTDARKRRRPWLSVYSRSSQRAIHAAIAPIPNITGESGSRNV